MKMYFIRTLVFFAALALGFVTVGDARADHEVVVFLSVNAVEGPTAQFVADLSAAREHNTTRIVVSVTNVDLLQDPELLAQVLVEIEQFLDSFDYSSGDSEIIQCAYDCELPSEPEEAGGNGETIVVVVNAPDGPTPNNRTEISDASQQRVSRIVVHIENTGIVDDAELVELVVMETTELLTSFGYDSSNSEIIQCPRRCGDLSEPEEPEVPVGNGETLVVVVFAGDGPTPLTREAIQNARARGVSRVVVHLEQTAVVADAELVELQVMEITELLGSSGYTPRNSEIVQCTGNC